jgi:hypothetical protein
MPVFRAEWSGLKESLDFLDRLGASAEKVIGQGVGRAAIRTQDIIRGLLEHMVYAQPSAASGYQRTYTLMRSVHAAPPSADHSADEGRTHAGADLAATSPEAVVEASGGVLEAEAGSWISYAALVHNGINQPQPRPFVSTGIPAAEAALEGEIMAAILKEFAKAPHG